MKWTKLTTGTWGTEVRRRNAAVPDGCLVKTVFEGEDWVETSMVWVPDITLDELQHAGEPREEWV